MQPLQSTKQERRHAVMGVRVTEELKTRWERACEAAGTTVSGGIVQLIEAYLNKGEDHETK